MYRHVQTLLVFLLLLWCCYSCHRRSQQLPLVLHLVVIICSAVEAVAIDPLLLLLPLPLSANQSRLAVPVLPLCLLFHHRLQANRYLLAVVCVRWRPSNPTKSIPTCKCAFSCIPACICMYVCVYAWVYTSIYICINRYMYTYGCM